MGLLATTALECTWGDNEPLIFLGEWCRRYERTAVWKSREHAMVRYHWDDRNKLRRDHNYLKSLHNELLLELASRLGEVHGLERPTRYWQILIDPWLSRYLAVVFDRWESLRTAFEQHEISRTITMRGRRSFAIRDQLEFLHAVSGDEWNHNLYADIIHFAHKDRCAIQEGDPKPGGPARNPYLRAIGWKRRIATGVDKALGRLCRNNTIAFVRPYFPLSGFVRLSCALGQVPQFYLHEFEWPNEADEVAQNDMSSIRREGFLGKSSSNSFESFVLGRIGFDLPKVFVEFFAYLGRMTQAIKLRPKVILTANDHANNDIFKRWTAQRVAEGAGFVIMEHGSGIPPLFSAMDCEEQIADLKTTWSVPFKSRQVRLPANKLAGRRRPERVGDKLVVIGQEMPRYAFDALSMPIAGQTLVGFDHICRLHDALDTAPQQGVLVKPYADLGWCTRKRFVERLGPSKVSTEPNLDRLMRRARLVVCTYPQTTLSEAVTCGAAAMLVYPRYLWETEPRFDGLIDALRAARIIFFDPVEAAHHISEIWPDPMNWWQSEEVRSARRRYEDEALDMRSNWIQPWVQFTKGLLSRESVRQLQLHDTRNNERD